MTSTYMYIHVRTYTHIPGLFDRALDGNLSEGKDYLELWIAYCDYMRRRIDFETDPPDEMKTKMMELRKIFMRARSHLNKCEEGREGGGQKERERYMYM